MEGRGERVDDNEADLQERCDRLSWLSLDMRFKGITYAWMRLDVVRDVIERCQYVVGLRTWPQLHPVQQSGGPSCMRKGESARQPKHSRFRPSDAHPCRPDTAREHLDAERRGPDHLAYL